MVNNGPVKAYLEKGDTAQAQAQLDRLAEQLRKLGVDPEA